MQWLGINKNGGQHNNYNKPGSGHHIHRPVILDNNGVKHPIVGHGYESHNSEQYSVRMEKIVKYRRFPGMEDEEYIPSRTEEYGTGDLSGRKDEFLTKSHDQRARGAVEESPLENRFRFNSPPSKDSRYASHDDRSGYVDFDINCADDDEHHITKGSRPNYLRDQEDYSEHAKPKTNGYSPPKYPVPILSHQDHNEKRDRPRTSPLVTPPRIENHATSHFKPVAYSPPSPRIETSHATSHFKPVAYSPPRFNPQPKQQGDYHQETIDSVEARRRYGMRVAGASGPGLHSGGTIDSKEAAKRYNGVLLTE
ncbi:hypothetical protein F511_33297 [Dorcoceras hygrometricum]|uniref:Uncharacterized protein n=1 Tax=Dorcoceras hygrometricum TaxID=472368 RepID=A0A2Z7CDC4_9LAMI|nr:hypothetical protein F511_33297 [Dorcoceras hygrometricum]